MSYRSEGERRSVVSQLDSLDTHADMCHQSLSWGSCCKDVSYRRQSVPQSSVRSIVSVPVLASAVILSFLVGGREETTTRSSSLSSSSMRSLLCSCLILICSSWRAFPSQCVFPSSEEGKCTFCLRTTSSSSSRVRLSSGRSSNGTGLGLLGMRRRVCRSPIRVSIVLVYLYRRTHCANGIGS
jgi:hypothetical protein